MSDQDEPIAGRPVDPSKTWKIQFVNPQGEVTRKVSFNLGIIEQIKEIHGLNAEEELIDGTCDAVKIIMEMIVKGTDRALAERQALKT